MKLGFGLYRHLLTVENYRFARQCGATHAVVHLLDYKRAGAAREIWNNAGLAALRTELARQELALHAIENFDPADWHDVLLAGPRCDAQIAGLQELVRIAAGAGVGIIGYNFSLGGVCSRVGGAFARGGAKSAGMKVVDSRPIPRGTVWNMVYDPHAPAGDEPAVERTELARRHDYFLERMLPVAEAEGVRLAAHPDDPPAEFLRGQPRFIRRIADYDDLLRRYPSPSWGLELCLGSVAEMAEDDLYAAVERYARAGRIGYIHFRNVRGKVPDYEEVFVDEGDIDLLRVARILVRHDFEGVMIPDHAPQLECAAGWHAGMAFAMGFMRAAILAAQRERASGAGDEPPVVKARHEPR